MMCIHCKTNMTIEDGNNEYNKEVYEDKVQTTEVCPKCSRKLWVSIGRQIGTKWIDYAVMGEKGAVVLSKRDDRYDFCYHAKYKKYAYQNPTEYMCEYLDHKQGCYCDGRGLTKEASSELDMNPGKIWEYLQWEYEYLASKDVETFTCSHCFKTGEKDVVKLTKEFGMTCYECLLKETQEVINKFRGE